jgi:hypothetical protein
MLAREIQLDKPTVSLATDNAVFATLYATAYAMVIALSNLVLP